jgi:hypothetical protein
VQARQDRQRPRRVGDDHALGDLEHQPVRRHGPPMAHRRDAVGEVALDQRARREVDGDAHVEAARARQPRSKPLSLRYAPSDV